MKRVTEKCTRKYMISRPGVVPNDQLESYYKDQVDQFTNDIVNDITTDNSGLNPTIINKDISLVGSSYTARNYSVTITYEIDKEESDSEVLSEENINMREMDRYVHDVLGR